MSNKELVERWFKNHEELKVKGMSTTTDKIFSYSTVICQLINGIYYINKTYYSDATVRHLNYIFNYLNGRKNCCYLDKVPINTKDLTPYIK